MLDYNNKIVTEATANLENKDFMLSISSFACTKYFIHLQTYNMKFKVITEGSPLFRSKAPLFSNSITFRDNNDTYIKVHSLFERVAPTGFKYTPSILCIMTSFLEVALKETKFMQDKEQQKKISKLPSAFSKNQFIPHDIIHL